MSEETTVSKPKRRRVWWLLACLWLLAIVAWTQRERLTAAPNAMARRQIVRRNEPQARWWLDVARRISERSAETEFLLARIDRKRGATEDMQRHLKRAKYLGYSAEALDREMWLWDAQSGRMDAAEPHLSELLRDNRGDGKEICEAYAVGYLKMREFGPAMKLIDAWEADFPDDPQPHYWKGLTHRDHYELEPAEKEFREALRLKPDHYQAAYALGEVLTEQKKPEEAYEFFVLAFGDADLRDDSKIAAARALRSLGRRDDAVRLLKEVPPASARRTAAVTELADLNIEQGKYSVAVERLAPLMKKHSRERELRYMYGVALRGVGRADEARKHLDYASAAAKQLGVAEVLTAKVSGDPGNADLRFQIGKIYLEFGDSKEGLIWLDSALKCDPLHRPTHQLLADYYQKKLAENKKYVVLARQHRMLAGDAAPTDPSGKTGASVKEE